MNDVFEQVLCGVDGSTAGETAARLAARVALPESRLTLVSVERTAVAVPAGMYPAPVVVQAPGEARTALERAREAAAPEHSIAATRLVKGDPVKCLEQEIELAGATLVVVGTHGTSRSVGIALGSVATHMLHEAPCSVLIAREPRNIARWPRSVVAGIDGSPESGDAVRVARKLAERFGASLRCVAATGGHVDLDAALGVAPELEELPGRPVDELAVLSEFADLVVVGSRGLKGLRALGSVSERVAHRAASPVLVVRRPR